MARWYARRVVEAGREPEEREVKPRVRRVEIPELRVPSETLLSVMKLAGFGLSAYLMASALMAAFPYVSMILPYIGMAMYAWLLVLVFKLLFRLVGGIGGGS